MERIAGVLGRSDGAGGDNQGARMESFQFGEEIHGLMMTGPSEAGSSFTALLELPTTQAMELLHPPLSGDSPSALLELPTSSIPSSYSPNHIPKNEPTDMDSYPNSFSPLVPNPTAQDQSQKSAKRKEREKKVRGSTRKGKSTGNGSSGDAAEKLPYVHVRARRGQATDSHSLAERVRREKINARMKLLQELVPGCNKITGTALVLEEIINHVQSLQRQVEFLSMRLAAVNPRIDFNLDSLLATETGSNFPSMVMPFLWSDFQLNENRQQCQPLWHMDPLHLPVLGRGDENHNSVAPENSLLTYDDSANSVSLHSNQLKMEL